MRDQPHGFEHVLAQRENRLARLGDFHPACRAMEQRSADVILEALQCSANTGLLPIELARRRTDPAGAHDINERAHQVPVHAAGELLVSHPRIIRHLKTPCS